MEENQKVPFYKKTWFIILALILFFPLGLVLMWTFSGWSKVPKWIVTGVFAFFIMAAAFSDPEEIDDSVASGDKSTEEQAESPMEEEPVEVEESIEDETEPVEEESTEEENVEEETEDNPIIVDENIAFSDYSITIKDVELEDNEAIVNMKFKNDSYTEDLSFIQSVIMSVYQGDNELEETSNEMMENAGSNNGIYYKHSTGIYSNVDLSYELIDDTTPLTIKFTPLLSEYDESQEIEIELQ